MQTARVVRGSKDNIPIRTNLAAWYRWNRGITNTGNCSAWADFSGNMRPLLQATAAAQPAIRPNGSLAFDGSNDFMQATFTLVQPFTIYMLLAQPGWTSGNVIFDGATGTVKATQSSGTQGIVANAGSSLSAGTAIGIATYGVQAIVFNGANSVYQSAGGGPSVTITGDAGANNPGGLTIGGDRSAANFARVNFREIAIYTGAHDATTRLQLLRYMSRIYASVGGVM